MSYITVNGLRLAHFLRKRIGSKESFVFIHGLGASKNSFEPCRSMDEFADYTLAAVDLPGCGESARPKDFSYTMKDQAHVVLSWIQHLDLSNIILVGHSMGGVIGLYVAEALEGDIAAFFNLEGNLEYGDCTFSAKVASWKPEAFEKDGYTQFKKKLYKMAEKTTSVGLSNYYNNICHAFPRALYRSSRSLVEESLNGGLRSRFLKLSMKKWYVFGEHSVNEKNQRFLRETNIPFFIVPRSGHFMMDDAPEPFYASLFRALKNRT